VQVRLDSSLVSRTLLVDLIHDKINRIYYVLLAMLTDAHLETTSDYWMQFGMTGVGIVYPTTQVVNGIAVPLVDFTIQPAANVTTHWQDLVDDIEVCRAARSFHTVVISCLPREHFRQSDVIFLRCLRFFQGGYTGNINVVKFAAIRR